MLATLALGHARLECGRPAASCSADAVAVELLGAFESVLAPPPRWPELRRGNASSLALGPAELQAQLLRAIELLAPVESNASSAARWRRLRGGGRPLAPTGGSDGDSEDGSEAADGALWTGDHLAREEDRSKYMMYRNIAATTRKLGEVLFQPEGLVGVAFGFWCEPRNSSRNSAQRLRRPPTLSQVDEHDDDEDVLHLQPRPRPRRLGQAVQGAARKQQGVIL